MPDLVAGRMVPFVILASFLSVAVVVDIRTRRIPNLLVLGGIATAMVWHAVGSPGVWSFDPLRPGGVGVSGCLAASLAVLLFFLPFYVMRFMGAGDVKLMAFVGATYGASLEQWVHLLWLAVSVLVTGGLLAVARMILMQKTRLVLANVSLIVFSALVGGRAKASVDSVFDPRVDTADRMPYAIAIALGALVYAAIASLGWVRAV